MNNFLSQALLYDLYWNPLLLPVSDLVVAVDTIIFCENPNEFELTLTVCNQGSNSVDAAIPITLYDGDPASGGTVFSNLLFTQFPLDTASCATQTYTVAWNENPFNLTILVNDDGSSPPNAPELLHQECDSTNNSVSVQVDGINVSPTITGFDPPYCFEDTVIQLTGAPIGGVFSGLGITGSTFNPINTAPGIHAITYGFSFGVCAFDTTVNVEVRPPLIIDAGSDTAFCSGETAVLGTAGLPGYSYTWLPNTGLDNASTAMPDLTITNTGTTDITQVYSLVADSATCNAQDDMTSIVYPAPLADFEMANVCLNEPNQFTDQSAAYSGTIVTYLWDFDDTDTDAIASPAHLYATAGIYDVQLNIETSFGCLDSLVQQIEVYELPMADFNAQDVCLIDSALFTDNSTSQSGNIVDLLWDLGDGDTVLTHSALPFSHLYATDGTYSLNLIVITEYGCLDTLLDTIVIFPVPLTDFLFDTVCFTHATQFIDLTTLNTGNVTQWNWDLGGTGTSQVQDPSHIFPAPGSYDVILTLASDNGCDGMEQHTITVYDLPEPSFTALPVCHGQTVIFSDSSVIANGAIANYSWNFGDPGTSSLADPTHLYPTAGFYNAQLILTSDLGCSDSITQEVEVYPLPVVAFSAMPDEGCMPLDVQFSDLSSIAHPYMLSSWDWNLGDGTASND